MSSPTTPPVARRRGSRGPSVRDELKLTASVCDLAQQQLRDELVLSDMEQVLGELSTVVENFGHIWLTGNGHGFSLALDIASKLGTPQVRQECPTRATVLGLNGAMTSTAYGKCGTDDALRNELVVNARKCDAVWCFASDPNSQALLNVATEATQVMGIPFVAFVPYPGTPLIHHATSRVRIQGANEKLYTEYGAYCIEYAHGFLANVITRQLKRLSRRNQ